MELRIHHHKLFGLLQKKDAIQIIKDKLGWKAYGNKHAESMVTEFYQNYILINKFHIDKRRAHLSSLICSKQITMEEAVIELEKEIVSSKKMMMI